MVKCNSGQFERGHSLNQSDNPIQDRLHSPPIAALRDVSVTFPGAELSVLQDVCLSINRGEFLTIVGPSGGGKSTLLRIIAGLLKPSFGQIELQPEHTENSNTAQSGLEQITFGFVFQQPTLLPWRTARQNLLLPLELGNQRMPQTSRTEAEATSMLRRVGLSAADGEKRPAELSGGMQMRLSLARALIVDPDILLLDEPLAAVDDLLRMRLQEDVRRLHDELNLTTILVTHNLQEAVFMSDRVIILSGQPANVAAEFSIETDSLRNNSFRQSMAYHKLVDELTTELIRIAG